MTDDDRRNGRHVEPLLAPVPVRPRLVELPRSTTREEAQRNYADVALAVNQHFPQFYGELSECRAAINLIPGAVETRIMVRLTEVGLVPPMRGPADTQTVFLDKTKGLLEKELEKLASESPGPLVSVPPQRAAQAIGKVLDEQLSRREQAKDYARLREKEALEKKAAERAEELRAETRRSIKRSVVAGVLTAAILAVAGYLIGAAKGHIEGVIEGRATAPVVTVPMPVPTPVLPAQAPASVVHP